ncbi:GNAT family N-acetyltransferase [Streptomyces sp. NPDC049585]|uniref:GNAT family N-acetyltransferase n=1 Tax=Streptomyces sp. NPDC049585 TaxID=3155154 RepID=UPI0034236C76
MTEAALLALFDREMRRDTRPEASGDRVEQDGPVVRYVGAGAHGWNGIVWSGLDGADEAAVDAVVAEQVRYFTALDREFEWKLYGHDSPPGLAGRLLAAGFVAEEEETLMVAETPVHGGLSASPSLPPGVRLEPVTDAAGVRLVAAVHELAFGHSRSSVVQQLLDELAADPTAVPALVAMAGDEPISAARLQFHPGTSFASLWSGGTVPAWRGRGVYRALVAARARMAAERGYRFLQVDALPTSRPILQRLGFVPLTTTTPYVYGPSVAQDLSGGSCSAP